MIEDATVNDPGKPVNEDRISKISIFLLVLLVVYVIIRGLAGAATKTLWYDELITLSVSSQGSLSKIWQALASGVDGQPPGFHLVETGTTSLIQNRHIALRLPSVLAFAAVLICIFAYLKKRSGPVIALLCSLLCLSTVLFERYAIEARPYCLEVACFAIALVCYQRTWSILLGLCFVVAQTFHHYSLFAMMPFGMAEFVYLLRTRRFRWPLWLALIVGPLPLAAFWPLLSRIRDLYGAHLFEQYGLRSLPATYGAFFLTDSGYGAAVVAVCALGVLATRFQFPRNLDPVIPNDRDSDIAEGTLLLGLIALPPIVYLIMKVMHGGMRDSYVLVAILGLCISIGCVLSQARLWGVAVFAVFLLTDVGLREFKFWESAHSFHYVNPSLGLAEFIRDAGYGESKLPIVFASGMIYVPMAHYAPGPLFRKMFYLTDEGKQLTYQRADTFDKHVKILSLYEPLQIRDYQDFTAEHPVFLLYGEDPGYGNTWLAEYLTREGYSVQALAVDPTRKLFLVDTRIKIQSVAVSK